MLKTVHNILAGRKNNIAVTCFRFVRFGERPKRIRTQFIGMFIYLARKYSINSYLLLFVRIDLLVIIRFNGCFDHNLAIC